MSVPVRRSMTAALKTADLPADAQAFIRGNSAKVEEKVTAISFPKPPEPTEGEAVASSIPPQKALSKGTARMLPVMVGLSTRIPSDVHEKLMRASFDRKLERHETWTHQDIVTEALTAWFKNKKTDRMKWRGGTTSGMPVGDL